jgi:hypothetical protein
VTRDNGRFFDLMPSPHSSWLLPPLADCSLVRREFQSPAGSVRFEGEAIELREFNVSALADVWHGLFTGASTGASALGQATASSPVRLTGMPFVVHDYGDAALLHREGSPVVRVHEAEVKSREQLAVTTTLPGDDSTVTVADDATVAEVASRVARLSGLSDERLAELFKVERETFCRWRTGVLTNPRMGNRRRLGLLLALLEDLHTRRVNIKDWLLNSVTDRGLTPYDLISRGRIDEAAFLAASVGEQPIERDQVVAARTEPEPLTFGDDDVWEFDESDDDEP